MSYPLEVKTRAREIFVEQGMTYKEVAAETGVSENNLKKWGSEGKWKTERQEFEKEFFALHSKVQKAKIKLLDGIIDKPEMGQVEINRLNTFAAIEKATARSGLRARSEDKASQVLDWLQRLVSFLQERDSEALRYLHPHLRAFADELKESA